MRKSDLLRAKIIGVFIGSLALGSFMAGNMVIPGLIAALIVYVSVYRIGDMISEIEIESYKSE
jgi:hypothetical protein